MKEWFKARNIWGAAINALSDEEAGRLMKALWQYTMTGEEMLLPGAERAIFALIVLTLNQDDDKDTDVSEKRSEAGAKGGKQRALNMKLAQANEANVANASNKNKNKEEDKDIKETLLTESKEKRTRFSPPSVEEVKAYCQERKNHVDPEAFVAFYGSKGWKIGNNPMKDWKQAIITWEKRDNSPRAAPTKTVVAQQYDQRNYSGVQADIANEQAMEFERRLRERYGGDIPS